jgi:hypothetical protein
MLNLTHKSDPVITELITDSLDLAMAMRHHKKGEGIEMKCVMKGGGGVELLSWKESMKMCERISFCHQSPGVYGFNIFHQFLIREALGFYCWFKNQELRPIIKGTKIIEIDFKRLNDYFFPKVTACPCCLRQEGIPFAEILDCKLLQKHEYAFSENDTPLFNTRSTIYPDEEPL